jgi:hypothetical protein
MNTHMLQFLRENFPQYRVMMCRLGFLTDEQRRGLGESLDLDQLARYVLRSSG